ncbi:putative ATPase [Hasllibacter halocynthiae]|uniref:Putative ATPase n=1 Tax=Hasllibacter halocynthiae TaxID=595589 RepID=A0A2T0X0U1_9RHOB|nr:ATP-binding protein [Hasllibacter halocynthiae]PRY92573.1 putative ATPase [Hasllibacter halocynthiae]
MAIKNVDEERLKAVLRESFSPARAISDPAHLRGRDKLLRKIEWAFNSPGKHVFIYGERGVGKTSLAQSAAVKHQSVDADPILIACDSTTPFEKIIADCVRACLPPSDIIQKARVEKRIGWSHGITAEAAKGFEKGVIPPVESINDAVTYLKYVAQMHSREPVIIFDEFDQIDDLGTKKKFADIIKQVSDQSVNVKFIFCGIASSLDELIGVHLSSDRYMAPVSVDPLEPSALFQILNHASRQLGVQFGWEELVRVAKISDGFAYYTHLIGEHVLRSMFDDEGEYSAPTLTHFDIGLRGAISEALGSVKQSYELAVLKKSDDYEEVLWAVADSKVLEPRPTAEIYEKSYKEIAERRRLKERSRKVLSQQQFYQRMNRLKQEAHGHILVGNKQGWYKFRENWMRGYVRLVAEEKGVPLGVDHHLAPPPDGADRVKSLM